MIEKLYLDNFKLFDKPTNVEGLKKVNLLTGVNGRGKSTLLQPLLLFAQTSDKNNTSKQLLLNGNFADIGVSTDAKYAYSNNDRPISLGITVDGISYEYQLSANGDNRQILDITKVSRYGRGGEREVCEVTSDTRLLDFLPLDFHNNDIQRPFPHIIYISADRIGPRLQYSAAANGKWMDKRGEYAIQMLYNHKGNVVETDLKNRITDAFPNDDLEPVSTIMDMLEYWLTKMFGKTVVDVQYVEAANMFTLQFGTEMFDNGKLFKPTNVGFGYSYVIPILVAGLTAPTGSVLIIENPESHLHPSAQSVVTRFLGIMAECGVQVFIETHSEHILNAFRVMVVQKKISPEDINVMYFDSGYEEHYKQIPIRENGELVEWPPQFFDQTELDLNIILDL